MSIVTVFSDREALERFKESEPELRTVAQIARMKKEEFVRKYAFGSFFNGDIRQARRVYETAVAINATNALIWANIKDTVASPFIEQRFSIIFLRSLLKIWRTFQVINACLVVWITSR